MAGRSTFRILTSILLTPFNLAVSKLCGFHLLVLKKKKNLSVLLVLLWLVMVVTRNFLICVLYHVTGAKIVTQTHQRYQYVI